jgi:HlyD family secretion protein
MPNRLCAAPLMAIVLLVAGTLVFSMAHAESEVQKKVQKLIDRLHGTTLPKGFAKTNGRIEATQVDVAAKYAGRLSVVTVVEGDEVTAGQVVARI